MDARHKHNLRFGVPVLLLAVIFSLLPGTVSAGSAPNDPDELVWTDRSTNLMWYRQGYRSYQKLYGGAQPASWKAVNAWIYSLNAQRIGGFSDWRLPTAEEYATLFRERAGAPVFDHRNRHRDVELYRLGYRPEIKGLRRNAWSGEKQGDRIVCYDFVRDRPAAYDPSLDMTYEFDALAVRALP